MLDNQNNSCVPTTISPLVMVYNKFTANISNLLQRILEPLISERMATYLKCRITTSGKKAIADLEDIPRVPVIEGIDFQQTLIDEKEKYVKVYGRSYEKNLLILEGEILFNRARKLWKSMENMIVNEKPIPPRVFLDIKEVIHLLLYTAQNIYNSKHSSMWNFQKNVCMFTELLKSSIINISQLHYNIMDKFTYCTVTLKSEPICEYFHSYLSIKYLIFYIDNLCENKKPDETIKNLISDLIVWSNNIYFKNGDNYANMEPFLCLCVKKLWLYLVHYLKSSIRSFWSIFNDVISNEDEEFIIWMMYHISILYLYDDTGNLIGISNNIEDNFELVTRSLQSVTSSNLLPERKISSILKHIDPLLTELWVHNTKLEPFQILWEYFYKTLDNTSVGNIRIPKNVREMVDLVDRLNSDPKSLANPYVHYLHMLNNHLVKNPSHWTKMRGRIYSRLPPQKMNNFNNTAIFQISLLFITLSQADVGEAIEKLFNLLEALSKDKQESEFVWILYLTLMVINIRHNREINAISTVLQNQIQEVAANREKFNLLKHYIAAMDIIMNSSQNYDLGQNRLLGPWVTPYVNTCTYTDLCQLLDNISLTITQIENCGKWYEFKHSFVEYILPALKHISVSNTVPPQVGELVGKIYLNTQEITRATIQYFCGTTINIKVTHGFLVTILGNNRFLKFSLSEESLLISSWFRICILSTDVSHQELASYIFNLSSVRNIITVENFENDPYTAFVRSLSAQTESQMNILRLKELCEICFGNIDQWLNGFLTPHTSDTQTTYLYTTISLFFYMCSPLLYHKSKSSCLFNRLISLLLLPTEVLKGKPPPSNILKAVERTWHLFIKGTYKLGHSSDPYIDRTLKDLVTKYMPHFPSTNSPILKILDEPKVAIVVLDKITAAFLLKCARSSEENTHKALKTLQNILDNIRDDSKIILVLERTLLGILEVIMFSNQKVLALDLIKSLISSGWYDQVQSRLQGTIQTATERHLAFNTSNYFQLIGHLIDIIPSSVRTNLPHLKNHICNVEKMRGVGFDNTLRQGLDKIEKALL